MLMLLTILCMSFIALALCSVALLRASQPTEPPLTLRRERKIAIDPPRFFTGDLATPAGPPTMPLDLLLTQLERHVRLEQAAAESFLDLPTPESLHSPSPSRFVN